MQTPIQIDLHGEDLSPRLRERIEHGVKELENRFGRIIAARIVVKPPSQHHKTGGLYEVGIHLTLPGGQMVNVERTPSQDERHGNPDFAINDAFKRARRKLQDTARRMDGQVKLHEPQPEGEVVRLDSSGEFGFLRAADGSEVYFHRNSVLNSGFAHLKVGSRVTYAEEQGNEGLQASTVKPMKNH